MEWKNIFNSIFFNTSKLSTVKSMTSKHDCKMSPQAQDKDMQSKSNWFPGQNLLGKLIHSTASGLSQGKGILGHPSFLRLNSQGGESSGSEDEVSSFPCVEPMKEELMSKPSESTMNNPRWGMFNPRASGHWPMPQAYTPRYSGYTYPGNFSGNGDYYCPQYHTPGSYRQPPPFVAWPAHINPNFMPQVSRNSPPKFVHNQAKIFHFQGHQSNGYKVPMHGKKRFTGSHKAGVRKQNRERPLSQQPSSLASNSQVMEKKPQDYTSSGQTIVGENSHRMLCFDISSENCIQDVPAHADTSSHLAGPEPTTDLSALISCQDKQTSSNHGALGSEDVNSKYINSELSLVADLCAMDINDTAQVELSHEADTSKLVDETSAKDKCDANTSNQGRIQAACIVLTPKMPCVTSSKKKKRPSSKKRQRRMVQKLGEAANNTPKKQRIESPTHTSCHEPMSFVIDFSESESEPQCANSSNSHGSPVAKFSLLIRAGDLSSDDDSTDSDSDFFDDDNSFEGDTTNKTAQSSKDWRSAFPDVGCLPPFTFQITCITNPAKSKSAKSGEDEVDSNSQTTSDDTSFTDPDAEKRLADANRKWESNYGGVSAISTTRHSEVQFPVEKSRLQTVFRWSADEDILYREARVSQWEQYARDRERFKNRIENTEKLLADCLLPTHRAKIYNKLYGC